MSIEVSKLTKTYGQQKAINQISFNIDTGEIVGFLGPNGAGKTTTMKVLTCFIPQTEGKATVCGYDVVNKPMEVRKRIGYLPEHNPLYPDMYVREYLQFVGGLQNLGRQTKTRIDEMVERTGLTKEQHKKIGQLSKGYRQRVGLAQALLHDPPVLILDEPTSGLDPNQLADIRRLIIDIGKEKTVMLSSHIMQEVQAVCDRVIIINSGQIVADDTTNRLQAQTITQAAFTIEFQSKIEKTKLNALENVAQIEALPNNQWRIIANDESDLRPAIFRFAVDNNLILLTLQKESSTLEEVFRDLTK